VDLLLNTTEVLLEKAHHFHSTLGKRQTTTVTACGLLPPGAGTIVPPCIFVSFASVITGLESFLVPGVVGTTGIISLIAPDIILILRNLELGVIAALVQQCNVPGVCPVAIDT